MTLSGPGGVSPATQSGTTGDDGRLRITWTINAFGGTVTIGGPARRDSERAPGDTTEEGFVSKPQHP